ncbi:hypothetical protein ACRE_014720 [Hapsidospora chrysogenum ATCC 11550]|uniref:Uncharacterized protein n=1 Tax=Hapsidospora chrysogenum (strain ATCC 11550 / CBS 779.69 / DSM 880 / IAM 14645 / JCM 23072 / IMI 49137) TaxID=857340 RepID=A0A086TDZ1_HAPC1|nr:hypothetical protein ACRE_014720 [Hapsidospora chrysogenum ATCC 11550]
MNDEILPRFPTASGQLPDSRTPGGPLSFCADPREPQTVSAAVPVPASLGLQQPAALQSAHPSSGQDDY